MGLPGNGTIPAVFSKRIRLAKSAGMKIMELVEKDIKPRDIMVKDAFINALTIDMALGCSTNSALHLPAIAHECEFKLNLDLVNQISERKKAWTPRKPRITKGYLSRYAKSVSSGSTGAVLE